jgi:hypothetical protein
MKECTNYKNTFGILRQPTFTNAFDNIFKSFSVFIKLF